MVSRDVVFSEEEAWNWRSKEANKENVVSDESEEQMTIVTPSTPPTSPQPVTPSSTHNSPTSSSSFSSDNSNRGIPTPIKMGSLKDVYERLEEEETNLFYLYVGHELLTFQEVVEEDCWRSTLEEEIHSIKKNDTWELSALPPKKKTIGVKWVYKIKRTANRNVDQFKARIVAKGYEHKYGIQYEEAFEPVAQLGKVRLLISLAAHHSWKIYQLDIKSAFFNGILEEEVYVDQP